jgi:hypothetical protein
VNRTAVATPAEARAERAAAVEDERSASGSVPSAGRPPRVHLGTAAVVVIGLLLTAMLSLGTQGLHDSNENRLLHQRVREAAAVVAATIPNVQSPLSSAAVLAEATHANSDSFAQLMQPLVTTGRPFVSASLWSLSGAQPRQVATLGRTSELSTRSPQTISQVLRAAVGQTTMTINDMLGSSERRLGYAYAITGPQGAFVVYAEAGLPKNRRAAVDSNSAFADLDYALYLGTTPHSRELLASSIGGALLGGHTASAPSAFGNSHILLVMRAKKELGGDLLARLPWALAGGGLLLTLAGAFLVERLLRRRDYAETLARENDGLYKEQRSVAQTLQHSLLPNVMPNVAGLDLATRYVAGVEGIDIGGDWYDIVTVDGDHIVFVVGDVSGRGLSAATTMAELRYAVRAYAMQGDPPELILTKVSRLIDVGDGHFATAVCGAINVPGHSLTIANAGHPAPLLVAVDGASFVESPVGSPLGVAHLAPYESVTMPIPRGATLLAYTDGLVERRGEHLDVGLARLKDASLDQDGSLEDLLTRILTRTIPTGSADDTAILGLRWQN